MTTTEDALSREAEEFHWLLLNFARETLGVREAVAVSADGLLLAASEGPGRANIDQIAAVLSGLSSLTKGAAGAFGLREVRQIIVELADGYLFVARISDGSALGVVAERNCDIGLVGYHMTVLVTRVGDTLSPELVAELTNALA